MTDFARGGDELPGAEDKTTNNRKVNDMAEEKAGKKPENLGEGGKATEEQEVGGRGQVLYTCWNCGAGNWIPSHWTWFTCWRDGALNYT